VWLLERSASAASWKGTEIGPGKTKDDFPKETTFTHIMKAKWELAK
jgi:hypothetical protein